MAYHVESKLHLLGENVETVKIETRRRLANIQELDEKNETVKCDKLRSTRYERKPGSYEMENLKAAIQEATSENQKRENAALCLQRHFRGWLLRANMKIIVMCAIRIQSWWRGILIRNELMAQLQKHKLLRIDEPDDEGLDETEPHLSLNSSMSGNKPQKKLKLHKKMKRKARKALGIVRIESKEGALETNSVEDDKSTQLITSNDEDWEDGGLLPKIERGGERQQCSRNLKTNEAEYDPPPSPYYSSTHTEVAQLRARLKLALHCLKCIQRECGDYLMSQISPTRATELLSLLDFNLCLTPRREVHLIRDGSGDALKPGEDEAEDMRLTLQKRTLTLRQRISEWKNQIAQAQIPGYLDESSKLTSANAEKRHDFALNDKSSILHNFAGNDTDKTEAATIQKIYNFNLKYFSPIISQESPNDQKQPPFTTLYNSIPKSSSHQKIRHKRN